MYIIIQHSFVYRHQKCFSKLTKVFLNQTKLIGTKRQKNNNNKTLTTKVKACILYIISRSASVRPSVTRQFRVLIRRRNRPGQSDSENGIRPGQSDFCTGNLRGRFCNPSLCPFVRPSVRLSDRQGRATRQKDLGNFRIWFSRHGFQDLGSQLWGLGNFRI